MKFFTSRREINTEKFRQIRPVEVVKHLDAFNPERIKLVNQPISLADGADILLSGGPANEYQPGLRHYEVAMRGVTIFALADLSDSTAPSRLSAEIINQGIWSYPNFYSPPPDWARLALNELITRT